MSAYVFAGYPAFLDAAAAELGRPDSVNPARRIVPLTALANLCAQAAQGHPAHVPGILAKASEFRDQLAIALMAADLMLADVKAGMSPEAEAKAELEPEVQPRPEPKPTRGNPKTPKGC